MPAPAEAQGLIGMAIALTVAGTGLATAWAEKVIGAASVGAIAEKPELFGRVLPLVVIPETIVIFGLLIAVLMLGNLGSAAGSSPNDIGKRPRGQLRARQGLGESTSAGSEERATTTALT